MAYAATSAFFMAGNSRPHEARLEALGFLASIGVTLPEAENCTFHHQWLGNEPLASTQVSLTTGNPHDHYIVYLALSLPFP